MPHVIEARGLTKNFGDFQAVAGITFHVSRGECYGLLGPNGAGKTTTIRMVYGFSPPAGGSLRVFGLEVNGDIRSIKRRLGVCQQANNLDPDLTVLDNLLVYARYFDIPRRQARPKALELLRFMALEGRKDAVDTELSGGMMRRLMLARALINDPELLILDEPTTGLDPQSRHQVWERLEELKAGGLSILLTTHYMEEASRLCDRVAIMDQGRILAEGQPADLVRRHAGFNVVEIPYPGEEARQFVRSHGLEHEDLGHRLIIHCQEGGDVYRELVERHCTRQCVLRLATLEDVFLKLTGRDLRE